MLRSAGSDILEGRARAGATTEYPWGDSIGSGNANCDGCDSQWDNKQRFRLARTL